MNSRYSTLLTVSTILCCIYSFIPSPHAISKTTGTNKDSNINYLSVYGRFVFEREHCGQCHTLTIDSGNNLISLDGVGIRYSVSWHFRHLKNPASISDGSTMPAYEKLISQPLSKTAFSTILPRLLHQKSPEANTDIAWQKTTAAADELYTELQNEFVPAKKGTEILALISYLQSIPSSAEKLRKDSMLYSELGKKAMVWDTINMDNAGIIYATAADPNNSKEGEKIYSTIGCFACHGRAGQGVIGPNLTDDYWLNGNKPADIVRVMVNGKPKKGMPPGRNTLLPEDVGKLLAYLQSIRGSNPPNAKMAQGEKE